MRAVLTAAVFALLGTFCFVVGALVHSLGTIAVSHWQALFRVSMLFAVLGAIFGTVLAFDRSADAPSIKWRLVRRVESPVMRTALCGIFGVLAVVIVQSLATADLPAAWFVVGGICGALLGWLGWRWAKYVDF